MQQSRSFSHPPSGAELSKVLESTFLDNPLKTAVSHVAYAPSPATVFPSSQLPINML